MDNQEPTTKLDSLSQLRNEIEQLEKNINEARRKELIIAEERSPLKSIYKWQAPERPFEPKPREWYIKYGFAALVIIILAVLTDTYLLIFAVVGLFALSYAMNTIPPQVMTHEITNKGLRVSGKLFIWKQIPTFWITERGNSTFINLEVDGSSEKKIILLVGGGNINIIAKELVKYIDYLNPSEAPQDLILSIASGKHKSIGDFYNSENLS